MHQKTSLFVCVLSMVCLSGCFSFSLFKETTDQTKKETTTSKENIDVKGTIIIDPEQQKEPDPLNPEPELQVVIGGKTIKVPNHSRVELKIDVENEDTTDSVTTMISKFRLDSRHGQLIIWGAVLFAVGLLMMWLGLFKLGTGACIMGGGLIGIAIMVDKYPFLILIFMCMVVIAIAYFIYQSVQVKNEKENGSVLKKVMRAVDLVPEAKDKVKQKLKEDDNSAKIREVTKRIDKSE